MQIFIDEAGNFVSPANGQSLYSLVLALVIPSSIENDLFQAFLRLRDSWPNNAVEIKGSKLDESQAAQVIDLVSRYDVFVMTRRRLRTSSRYSPVTLCEPSGFDTSRRKRPPSLA